VNPKLAFGATLLLALAILALLPQRLAPYPKGYRDAIRFEKRRRAPYGITRRKPLRGYSSLAATTMATTS